MPAIPVRNGANPCFDHGCSLCCYETEMPLREEDIARLVARGHARDSFVEMDPTGYPILKNVPSTGEREGHHCVFLADGKCGVYADRPEGCRWYPITITPDRRMVKDDDCPHRSEFTMPAASQRRLVKLLNELEDEAWKRRQGKLPA